MECQKILAHIAFERWRNGCSRDDINIRGRWERNKQMVDVYLDPEIPYPDAKTAAALCIGGAVKYAFVRGSGLDDSWFCDFVVPHLFQCMEGKKAVVILGNAILWACFDAEAQDIVPLQVMKRVMVEYERVRKVDNTVNPVRNTPLVICGHEGQLIVEELILDPEEETSTDAGVSAQTPEEKNRRRSRHTSEMQSVLAQLMVIRKQNKELNNEVQ